MNRETRYDFGESTGKARKTSQGFLRVPARLTRTGVLTYKRSDGSTVRELRHPDEVFAPASLASMGGSPITDLHPSEQVSASNATAFARGFVAETIRRDGKYVAGELVIMAKNLIDLVERGDRAELSPGYTCEVDPTPGVYEGERYDAIQRGIVYNHLAVGPSNWGRSGPEVRLHMDGGEAPEGLAYEYRTDDPAETGTTKQREIKHMETKKIRVDGVEHEVAAAAASYLEKAFADRDARLDASAKQLAELEARAGKAEAERDDAREKLAAATDEKALAARVDARAKLVQACSKILGEDVNASGKSDRDLRCLVLETKVDGFKAEGRSDAYLEARFDALLESAPVRSDASDVIGAIRDVAAGKPTGATRDARNAHAVMVEEKSAAWVKPTVGLSK